MTAADVELTRRYQTRLAAIAAATAAAAAQDWDRLTSFASDGSWRLAVAPVIAAGQAEASALAAAFVAVLAGIPTPSVSAAAGPDVGDPFIAFGSAIRRGLSFETAVALGRSRAELVGSGSVQWNARAAVGEAARGVHGVVGYRRVLTGSSCEWCARVSTQRYRTADSASFGHTRCDCALAPIIGDRDPGQVINRPVHERLRAASEHTGYVDETGAPTDRPPAIPQVPAET